MTETQLTAVEPAMGEFGKSRTRKEDARLITGKTRWTDNLAPTGTLHVAFLRSPHAHARITRVDTSQAKNRPGVVAVFSGEGDPIGTAPRPNRSWKPFKAPVMERKYEVVETPTGAELYELYAGVDGVRVVRWGR